MAYVGACCFLNTFGVGFAVASTLMSASPGLNLAGIEMAIAR